MAMETIRLAIRITHLTGPVAFALGSFYIAGRNLAENEFFRNL
jgi:hypothetical protein